MRNKLEIMLLVLFIIFTINCWELGHIGQYDIQSPTPEEMIGWVNYPDIYVSHMAEDIYGNIWCAGTVDGRQGVYKFDGTNWLLFTGEDIGVPDPVKVNDIYCAQDGMVYVALATGYPFNYKEGIGIFDGSKWTVIKESPSGLVSNQVNCLCVDENNNLWAGTDKGLSMFDGTSWRTFTIQDGLPNDTIFDVDFCGKKVVCCTKRGYGVYNDTVWLSYKPRPPEATYPEIAFKKDRLGNIWTPHSELHDYMYYDNGFLKFNGREWMHVVLDRSSHIFAFDMNNDIWVANAHYKDGEWEEFWSYRTGIYSDPRGNSGLLDNGIHEVFVCKKNNKWFATNGGLSRYELD